MSVPSTFSGYQNTMQNHPWMQGMAGSYSGGVPMSHPAMGHPQAQQNPYMSPSAPTTSTSAVPTTPAATGSQWGANSATQNYTPGFNYYGYGGINDPTNPWGSLNAATYQAMPWVSSQLNYAASNQPGFENVLNSFMQSNNPGQNQGKIDAFGQQAQAQAKDAGNQQAMMLGAQGQGSGATQGAMLDASNQGSSATNAYASNLASPQGQASQLQNLMGAYQMAMNPSSLNSLLPMEQAADQGYNGQNQYNLQNNAQQSSGLSSLFGGLGSILGGGGLSSIMSMFGGGGSSGGGSGTNLGNIDDGYESNPYATYFGF